MVYLVYLSWWMHAYVYYCIFQSDAAAAMQRKPKLTLTRPKTPEFETSQRVRSVKIKSSAEMEEEIMAKIPKFKARPLNKKVNIYHSTRESLFLKIKDMQVHSSNFFCLVSRFSGPQLYRHCQEVHPSLQNLR